VHLWSRALNLTYVLAFHRVATAGSFTRAASMSGVSQPTLSAQVRGLERSVGASLFHREGRQIRLTAAGERLLQTTTRLADAIEEVESALAEPRSGSRGTLRISADSAIHVIPALAELKRTSPDLRFSIRVDNSQQVTAHVINNEADLGVMARPVSNPRLASVKIREDRLVLLVGPHDAWFKRKRVQIADLAGRDLVVREKGSITREVMERCLVQAGVEPGQTIDVGTREAVKEAVAAGFGVGVVFASEAGGDSRLRSLGVLGADLSVGEYAICRTERRRIALIARFFEVAQKLAHTKRWLSAVPLPD
jgi:LysR family transcriptional regulator, low CO2-responsive transcriptional regulator